MAVGSLRATVADAPAANTAERPAALFCSAGPGLVQVGRAKQQRTRGPPRGVQHTAIAASAAGACRLGRYRGQRGPAPLNPSTVRSAEHRVQLSTKQQTRTPHARWRRAVVATGCGRCNMQHGLLLAGGSVAPQTSKQKHARRRTHAHAHACVTVPTFSTVILTFGFSMLLTHHNMKGSPVLAPSSSLAHRPKGRSML